MNWIKNNILPIALIVLGFIANDTDLFLGLLNDLSAPLWLFKVVKWIGIIWAAFKLHNAKSAKIKAEIEEALKKDPKESESDLQPQGIIGTPNVPKSK